MWWKDFPEHDPDSNYPEPTAKQRLYAEKARQELDRLKTTLEKLTVPQQRAIFRQLSGTVFRQASSVGAERAGPIEATLPAHESEAQALTEASQIDQ
ncbi:MAG: hypothetical protein WB609_10190 [Candidatus Cybelea sp.]